MDTTEYTPAQASAVANLPLPAVHKLIERRLIRPRRLRTGRSIQRMLSRGQVLYLRLEAEGVRFRGRRVDMKAWMMNLSHFVL